MVHRCGALVAVEHWSLWSTGLVVEKNVSVMHMCISFTVKATF